jgi:hypothetical protein
LVVLREGRDFLPNIDMPDLHDWKRAAESSISGNALHQRSFAVEALGYFSELLIDMNLAFILASIPATLMKIPSAMPEAIRQYSMAVAALSSLRNLRTEFIGQVRA